MTRVRATYRLQLRNGVGFAQAARLAPYLADLGVSHLYLSPVGQARSGSTHGYDVTDHSLVDAALGGRRGLERLAAALQRRGLAILLDIVPNHMAASPENPWWRDVLLRGTRSRYAGFFDIDWDAFDGKVLVPVLGRPYGEALQAGEIDITRRGRRFVARYFEHAFPVRGASSSTRDPQAVDAILSRQAYQLAWWRTAREQINYRRFFDITDLVCVRVERPEVFDAVHAMVLDLVAEGIVDALRVDHIDGLADPDAYLRRLRALAGDAPVFVEKILGTGEQLHPSWPTEGTTGYEFAVALDDAMIDPDGFAELHNARPIAGGFDEVVARAKREAVAAMFPADVDRLTRRIVALARGDARGRDLSEASIRRAVQSLSCRLPVYRTYVSDRRPVSDEDRRLIAAAVAQATDASPPDAAALRFLRSVLVGEGRPRASALEVAARWQQLTGPLAAKGVEDTAMYRYPVLWSRNEVGAEPDEPPGVEALHRLGEQRAASTAGLSLTTSHDTKRSEDVRWRLHVLSQVPDRWVRFVAGADRRAASIAPGVTDPAVRTLLYTAVLGTWPAAIDAAYRRRIEAYMTKALREAKVHTRWTDPDDDFEAKVAALVRGLLADPGFVRVAGRLSAVLAKHGAAAALGAIVLKAASPGAPDVYQGQEVWNPSLVDPDNRRAVDFAALAAGLRDLEGADARELLRNWQDGRIKQFVTWRSLQARAAAPELFARGEYIRLRARGPAAGHVIAFARRAKREWGIAIAPRLSARLSGPSRLPSGSDFEETSLEVPGGAPSTWTDSLTGRRIAAVRGRVPLAKALATIPTALLLESPASEPR